MVKPKPHTYAVLASRLHQLYRVGGHHEGIAYWAYVLVDDAKLNNFSKAIKTGRIHVQEFGRVLAWGEGVSAPPRVAEELKEKYGYELIA